MSIPSIRTIGAIDAGTNALRIVIAQRAGLGKWEPVYRQREPVRLGRDIYAGGRLTPETLAEAQMTFRRFRKKFDANGVGDHYRAVGTSAIREAENQREILAAIHESSGIQLEPIPRREESRLTRLAVLSHHPELHPRLILDMGGGSLVLNLLSDGELCREVIFPIGNVRTLAYFQIDGPINKKRQRDLRHYVRSMFEHMFEDPILFEDAVAMACGGNPEDLARVLSPGKLFQNVPALEISDLTGQLPTILQLTVTERMARYDVGKNRAEVMGVAALTLAEICAKLRLQRLITPGIGVREGILYDLAAKYFNENR